MSEMMLEYLIKLRLSREEFRLIGLALAGRLPARQQAAAMDLNKRLLQQQADNLEEARALVLAALTHVTTPEDAAPTDPSRD